MMMSLDAAEWLYTVPIFCSNLSLNYYDLLAYWIGTHLTELM